MKVIMVSGSIPPEPCGVGDYTSRLSAGLAEDKIDVELTRHTELKCGRLLRQRSKAVIHIQYPTMGYGKSLYPYLLGLAFRPTVVTLHEFSQAHLLRKFAEIPLILSADRLVLTTHYELEEISKIFPEIQKKSVVIPVAAAMSPVKPLPPIEEREGFIYFGLIRPNKGLEEFIQAARILRQLIPEMPIKVLGAVPAHGEGYLHKIKIMADDVAVDWVLNKPLDEVSAVLLNSKYAYLHFPDGLSERRSSFMAAISHGVVVFSNTGSMTSDVLKNSYLDVSDAEEVVSRLIQTESGGLYSSCQMKALEVSENYSWKRIIMMHKELYDNVLS